MVNTSKQTPLTVENFEKLIMPVLNKKFESIGEQFGHVHKEIKSVRSDLTNLAHTVNDLRETVEETNDRVKYLPTTEEYLASQDKLMGELNKSTEATILTSQHYTDTNDRIDRIDAHTGFNSLTS